MNGFLARLLMPAMEWLCDLVGQYGLAIIIATVLFRLLLLPFDIMQRKSSLRMQALAPKIEEINKRFANDPQKRQQAVAQLQKKSGVNTMSGCLPLLIQLPFFAAFFNSMRTIGYNVTLSMYEMVKAGDMAGFEALMERCRFLWVSNVFQPDAMFTINLKSLFGGGGSAVVGMIPTATEAAVAFKALGHNITDYAEVMADVIATYNVRTNGLFIIAIVAGIASFLQQKLTPQSPATDPAQQGTMKGMMIFMTFFSVYLCATYNAAFGLYWMVTVAFGMIVQFILRKIYTPERLAKQAGVETANTFPDRKAKKAASKEEK